MRNTTGPQTAKHKRRNYFKREKTLLKILGISLTGNESLAYKIYSFLCIVLIDCLYPLLDLRELFINEFDVVVEMMIYVFAVSLGCIKALTIVRNRIQLGKILSKLEQKPFTPNHERGGETEVKLITECIWITNIQTVVYWSGVVVTVFFSVVVTLSKRIRSSDYHDWQFTYGPFTVLNVTYSPNYEISWFYQNLSLLWIGLHFCTIDVICASVLAHISYQFEILQNNFRLIVKNSYREMTKDITKDNYTKNQNRLDNSVISWKYLQQSLKQAVEYHLAIIGIANEMEHILRNSMLLIFFFTLIAITFVVYRASVLPLTDSRFIKTAGEAVCACFQILIFCYWGNQVILESQNVGKAVLETDFAGTDIKFQKSLILVIRRSQNPTKITAGRFTDICLATFAWFLRTAYSAFMLLQHETMKKDI